MTWLLDGNVLVALVIDTHEHHARARAWAERLKEPFATCSTTQGTLLRLHMQFAADRSAAAAWGVLRQICADPSHEFWNEAPSYLELKPAKVLGYRQVTDAWLAGLARRRKARVATLDAPFAALHPDAVTLLPTA
jgi:toxin-antitoxin system PIN domain toxin